MKKSWREELSIFSLFIIPYHVERRIEVRARLFKKEQLLRTYESVGSYRVRIHLVFLPLGIWQRRVEAETRRDTLRDVLLLMQRDVDELFGVSEKGGQ